MIMEIPDWTSICRLQITFTCSISVCETPCEENRLVVIPILQIIVMMMIRANILVTVLYVVLRTLHVLPS